MGQRRPWQRTALCMVAAVTEDRQLTDQLLRLCRLTSCLKCCLTTTISRKLPRSQSQPPDNTMILTGRDILSCTSYNHNLGTPHIKKKCIRGFIAPSNIIMYTCTICLERIK